MNSRKQPVNQEGGRSAGAILAELARYHLELDQMCAGLEQIADALPAQVNQEQCAGLARSMNDVIARAHAYEEAAVFPLMRQIAKEPGTDDTIERLRFEHWEDESFAAELQETLCRFAMGEDRDRVDALAWMLRGFFEGLRRHIAFEREHVMPLLARARS